MIFSSSESQCVRVWDDVMCWPPTPAGQLAILPCPSHIKNIDTSRKSTSGHPCLEWLDQCETFATFFFMETKLLFTFDSFYRLIWFSQSEYRYSSSNFNLIGWLIIFYFNDWLIDWLTWFITDFLFPVENASRQCMEDGTWFVHPVHSFWTNFTQCTGGKKHSLVPPLIEVNVPKNPD